MESCSPGCEIWESGGVDRKIGERIHVWDIEEETFKWNTSIFVTFDYFVILGKIIVII
jgi:hypothetical protein